MVSLENDELSFPNFNDDEFDAPLNHRQTQVATIGLKKDEPLVRF